MRFRFLTLLMLILSAVLLTAPPTDAAQLVLSEGKFIGEPINLVPTWYLKALQGDVTGDSLLWSDLTSIDQAKVTTELTNRAAGTTSLLGGAANTGLAGGAVDLTAGAGGANTLTSAGGAGGAASLVGAVGGATATGTAGAGGDVAVTAGAGGATSGAGTGGAGGTVTITPGLGGSTSGGTNGVPGMVRIGGTAGSAAFGFLVTRSTITNAAEVTAAQMRGHVLYQDASGGNVTMNTITGTAMSAAFPDAAVGTAIPIWVASNHGSNTSTISGDTDFTLVGSGAVTQLGGMFLAIKTAATTWDLVRVG